MSPPVNGKSYYRVSQTVCRAEYREVLIRIRRFIVKIVGVNVKGRERGLKSFDWKYCLSSIWLTMIETNDGLINEWLKRFERSIYKGMFISCLDKRKNFYLLKKKCMDCILFIFQKIFLKENCSFVEKWWLKFRKKYVLHIFWNVTNVFFQLTNESIFSDKSIIIPLSLFAKFWKILYNFNNSL